MNWTQTVSNPFYLNFAFLQKRYDDTGTRLWVVFWSNWADVLRTAVLFWFSFSILVNQKDIIYGNATLVYEQTNLPKIGTFALLKTLVPISSFDGCILPQPATTAVLPGSTRSESGKQMGVMWRAYPASVTNSSRARSNLSGWVALNWNFGWTMRFRTYKSKLNA